MRYRIEYLRAVYEEDLPEIQRSDPRAVEGILKKINLLSDYPFFGKPLSGELKGYFRLPYAHYRIIYSVERDIVTVTIVLIGKRKDNEVYRDMRKRKKP